MKKTSIILGFLIAVMSVTPSVSDETRGSADGHKMTDDEKRGSASGEEQRGSSSGATEASGEGVINAIDAENGKVNLTHAPIAELDWPKMTMDLPVTRRVDLSAVKPGAKVNFKLKLGRDKQYRVIEITPSE